MAKAKKHTSKVLLSINNSISIKERRKVERKMLLSARIADALDQKGWKKTKLANAMNKSPSEISKWLSGTHNFTVDTLEEIGFFLQVNFFETYQIERNHARYVAEDIEPYGE